MISREEFIENAKDILKHYNNNTKEKNYDDIVCRRGEIILFCVFIAIIFASFFLNAVQFGIFFFSAILVCFILFFFIIVLPYEKHKKLGYVKQNKVLEKILYDWNIRFTFSNVIICEYQKDLVNDGYVYMVNGADPFYIQEGCGNFGCFTRFYWKYNHSVDKNEAARKIEEITKLFHVKNKQCEFILKKEKMFIDVNDFRLSCFLTGMERPKTITEEQELERLYENLKALQNLANGTDNARGSK